MIPLLQTTLIAIILMVVIGGYVVLFAIVCQKIGELANLVSTKRKTRKFFKKIERYRRDFA